MSLLLQFIDKVWTSLRLCSDVSRSGRCHRFSSSPDLVDTQFGQRQVAVGYVAAMRDQGQDFLGHLCQSQVPVVPESPGVSLPGDSAPGLPIGSFSCVDIGIAGSSICVKNNHNNHNNPPPGAGHRVVVEGLSSQSVRPLRGLTGEARSRPGVTVAGGPRGPIGYGRGPRALYRRYCGQ